MRAPMSDPELSRRSGRRTSPAAPSVAATCRTTSRRSRRCWERSSSRRPPSTSWRDRLQAGGLLRPRAPARVHGLRRPGAGEAGHRPGAPAPAARRQGAARRRGAARPPVRARQGARHRRQRPPLRRAWSPSWRACGGSSSWRRRCSRVATRPARASRSTSRPSQQDIFAAAQGGIHRHAAAHPGADAEGHRADRGHPGAGPGGEEHHHRASRPASHGPRPEAARACSPAR